MRLTATFAGVRRWALVALLGALAGLPKGTEAQQDGCVFAEGGNDRLRTATVPGGTIYYITRPHLRCEGGVEIWADSATSFTAQNLTHLVGAVRFVDRTRELRSAEARYFSNVGRLQAQGNLYVRDIDRGSVIENGDLVYLRQTDFRDEDVMTVTTGRDQIRPKATLVPAAESGDSVPRTETPYEVVGDEIFLRGNAYFRSRGRVEIRRDSMSAFADSVEYERAVDRIRLRGAARVDAAAYDLVGDSIDILAPESQRSGILAMSHAVLTGEDLRLTSASIELFLSEGALERLVAGRSRGEAGPGADADVAARPVAVSEQFEITADSLELLAPSEVVDHIFAAGSARSVSHSRDSLNVTSLPEIAQSDWLEGDTIIVTFVAESDTVAAQESSPREARIDRITAKVNARSLYRIASADTSAVPGVDPPAVHYVVGDEITIMMLDGDVDRLEVVGRTRGIHLEPARRPARVAPPPDSIQAVPPGGEGGR